MIAKTSISTMKLRTNLTGGQLFLHLGSVDYANAQQERTPTGDAHSFPSILLVYRITIN